MGVEAGVAGGAIEVDAGVAVEAVEVDGISASLALALLTPRNETVRSSTFQQFFLMSSKLMVGLRRSNVRLLETTPRARHKAVIKVGNPSFQELDWAMEVDFSQRRPSVTQRNPKKLVRP